MSLRYMKQYVLGFLFNEWTDSVLLIRKCRPKWQAGLLNGIGGKIKSGEPQLIAMIREFGEEAGVTVSGNTWTKFCRLSGSDFEVHCFHTWDDRAFKSAKTKTDERIVRVKLPLKNQKVVPNLHWLIPLALNGRRWPAPRFVTAEY